MNESSALERLDALLRGEIAAAQTYAQVLDESTSGPEWNPLRSINQDHGDAIHFLHDRVSSLGGDPSVDSGPWGAFARAVEGTALLISDVAALRALRHGEKQGLAEYEAAVQSGDLPQDCTDHIETIIVPRQRRHLDALDHLIEQA